MCSSCEPGLDRAKTKQADTPAGQGEIYGRDAQELRSVDQRAGDPAEVARRRLLQAPRGRGRLYRHHSASQRDRQAPHGPRYRRLHPGRHHPYGPHARQVHALGAGYRPRRYRHADQGRQKAQERGHQPPEDWPRQVCRRLLGLDPRVRRHHRRADQAHGLLRRL